MIEILSNNIILMSLKVTTKVRINNEPWSNLFLIIFHFPGREDEIKIYVDMKKYNENYIPSLHWNMWQFANKETSTIRLL